MKHLLAALCALLLSFNVAWAAVNANQASVDELQTVRGIGPSIANRIVEERRKGPYKSLDDLQVRVKGVGEASIRKMSAGGLTVSGANRRDAKAGAGAASPSATAKADATSPARVRADSAASPSRSEPALAGSGSVRTVERTGDKPVADKSPTEKATDKAAHKATEKATEKADAVGAKPRP